MAPREPRDSPSEEELTALVDRCQPGLAQIFIRYCIAFGDAEELVFDALGALVERWGKVRDRERWLLAAVEDHCQARLEAEMAEDPDGSQGD